MRDNKSSNVETAATVATALIFIIVGFLVLRHPDLIKWWIALAFIAGGVSHLIRALKN